MSDEENPDVEPLIQNEEPVTTPDPLKFKTLLVSIQTPEFLYYRTMMVKPIPLILLMILSVFLFANLLQVAMTLVILTLMFICLVVEFSSIVILKDSFDDSKVLHAEIRRDHWASLMCPFVHLVWFIIACNVGLRFYLAAGSLLAIYQTYLTIIIIGQLDASVIISPLTKKFTKIMHIERTTETRYHNIDKTGLPDGRMSITELN